jgi:alpha-glucosidase (family GH31 glycosyl hydrolase)
MAKRYSRRSAMKLGAATAAVLLQRRFTAAEMAPPAKAAATTAVTEGQVGMELTITAITEATLRISIAAAGEILDRYYDDGAIAPRKFAAPILKQRTDAAAQQIPWGKHTLQIATQPLRVSVKDEQGTVLQELTFHPERNEIGFSYANSPVYGMGPGAHPLDRRGVRDMMRNGAGDNLRIFGARNPIPWLMGKGWGLFIHEPGGQFDLTGDAGSFRPSDGARGQDLYLCVGETPAELLRQYAEITGYPHLPAKWVLGFQQSHRTLDSREQIIEEAKTFREKKLPCDTVIYLGTGFCPSGWNTGHGSFVFNKGVFPDPAEVIREFHDLHFNLVLHVVNPPENLHGRASDAGAAATDPSDAAEYWRQHVPLVKLGVDGWWPDEGDILPVASRLVRNRMYWEGGRMTTPNKRPFALHRNCYAGIQRWGWLWSGDTESRWETLKTQIAEGIQAGLSGVPYWGTDIGGFVPTGEFTAELFVRWFQFGSFCPSFRCHGRTWQLRRPWGWDTGSYGPSEMGARAESFLPKPEDLHNAAIEPICRKYLNTRYQLMPYLYSAAWETHTTGIPLIRSLGLVYPEDTNAWATADAYLWGPNLLVAPVFEKGATERKVYLPAGGWYDYWTAARIEGGSTTTHAAPLDTLPLFVRAGSILPTGPVKQYAAEPSTEKTRLTVYPGADGRFQLYDDDGLSFAYEHGAYRLVDLRWDDGARTLHYRLAQGGTLPSEGLEVSLLGGEAKRITPQRAEQTIKL